MKKLSNATLLALAGITSLGTQANNKLEETIVTSSRVEMPLREVAASVSVVTKEEIELRGFSTVANTLRYEPAISVASNGGVGSTTEVRIRGERGFRTKVYIDGIDVTDASSPQAGPNFANMMTGAIDRIEILRGPQGLSYGADAGGVINMYTAAPQSGITGGLDAEVGRYDTVQYAGHLSGGTETVDGALSMESFETDGFNALTTDTVLLDDDGYENTTFHGRTGWNITDKLRAEIVGRTVEGKNDYDYCSLPPTYERGDNCKDEYDQDAGRAALTYQGGMFFNTLSYNINKSDRKFHTDGIKAYTYKGEIEEIDYLGNWRQSDALTLVYGAEFEKDSIETTAIDADNSDDSRDQEGYFLEYQGGFADSLYLSAGARYTDNEDFGTKTTYRTGAVYLLKMDSGEFKFKATYGTGFRAPSLSEIAYNEGPLAYEPATGTELGAEESKGYDAGVAYYASSGWYVDAVYFDQKIDDEIYYDLIDYSGYLQDDGESSSKGVELISQVPVGDILTFSGNYTYTDSQDFEGDQRLRTPKHMGNLGILLTLWDARLQINLNLRMSRDFADESYGKIDNYEVLDLSVSYQVLEALQVYGRIENITDEDYQEIPDYNTPGAAGYAGVRYRF